MANIAEEIRRRRTFAIISHPDAGKTTLTEKFLLYGGAINLAGTVKGRKATKHAVSDWMEIEKERGISVTSSVLQFNYEGYCINILDTPGHQDFSEDTYRTLMAAVLFSLDRAGQSNGAAIQQKFFGQGRFTRIGVGDNRKGASPVDFVLHRRRQSQGDSSIRIIIETSFTHNFILYHEFSHFSSYSERKRPLSV